MPTVLRIGNLRFFFFSREEERMHIHIVSPDGEAKYWLEPEIEKAMSYNISNKELKNIEKIIKEHQDDFRTAWREHFEC